MDNRNAVMAGSFDPMTIGHVEIIERAVSLFPSRTVHVLVAENRDKKHFLSLEDRFNIAKESLKHLGNQIKILKFRGIISDYINDNNVDVIVRGIRNSTDFDYEIGLEQFTRATTDAETVYLSPFTEHLNTSSTLVRNFLISNNLSAIEKYVAKDAIEVIYNAIESKK